jgi:glycyl-tRNA synthetase beta chain
MPLLVVEIGTEEMPAGAVASALKQFETAVQAGLEQARIPAGALRTLGTPRRLILLAEGVPTEQPDLEKEVRGPAKNIAFNADGTPTGAAQGFARKLGLSPSDLIEVDVDGTAYAAARVTEKGGPSETVIGPILEHALKGLSFPKTMRWGDGSSKFVRPVRWLFAMLDDRTVPFSFGGHHSGNKSRGHRFLSPQEFTVAHASQLLPELEQRSVMPDPEQRRQTIMRQADALAASVGGRIPWDEELLEENVWLVETPTALLGRFQARYLELPRPVLVTAMKKHQRFFPVEDENGTLVNAFIAIRSGNQDHLEIVTAGNERVLEARFADASHFLENDRRTTLEQCADQLGRLIFQEKLGTMLQKRHRLEALIPAVASAAGLDAAATAKAVRAARLCKADLVTNMVIELPALQGVIGREYALAQNEDPEVAQAIAEHYLPKSAGGPPPVTVLGTLLAVADRIDTLVGYVGLGILPSGSSDPYGLRRAAHGIVQMLATHETMPSLEELQEMALQAYASVNQLALDRDALRDNLHTLFEQRLQALLEDRGIRYDMVAAALSGGMLHHTLVISAARRAECLQTLLDDKDFWRTVQAAARVSNILKSSEKGTPRTVRPDIGELHSVQRSLSLLEHEVRQIDTSRFVEPSERALYDAAYIALPEVARNAAAIDFPAVYSVLTRLNAPVDSFFDAVMVMADDPEIRANRLALLRTVDALYRTLADFTRIVQP